MVGAPMRLPLVLVLCCGSLFGCAALLGLDDDDDDSSGNGGSSGAGSSGLGTSSGEGTDGGGGSSGTIGPDGGPSPIGADIAEGERVLSAGAAHTCVVTSQKTVKCWGAAELLGRDDDSERPVDVVGLDGVTELASGADFACALREDGSVWCWGKAGLTVLGPEAGGAPRRIQLQGTASALAAGDTHACAVVGADAGSNRVWCWGVGQHGKLGSGGTADERSPVAVTSAATSTPTFVAAGADFTCAVNGTSMFECWGKNDRRQLGVTSSTSTTPLVARSDIPLIDVAAGADFACGRGNAGVARCWGDNSQNQLARADAGTAVELGPPLQNDLRAIRSGARHTCFLIQSSGNVRCVGEPSQGRIGPGVLAGPYDALAAGAEHTCVARRPNRIECFGANQRGQLGRSGEGGAEPGEVAGY